MKTLTILATAAAAPFGVAIAQTSNPYLTYSALCPAATVAASSKAVHSCEQHYFSAIMDRKDCKPVPVQSCECEWFNSWVSTCMANICPTAGIASIVSEQGPVYCSATGTGTGTAVATGASTGGAAGSKPGATTTAANPAGTTSTKSGGAGGIRTVPLVGGIAAGLVGLVAVAL